MINNTTAAAALAKKAAARRIEAIGELKKHVAKEARETTYPGETNGPADAYRHILGIAELTRREGFMAASALGVANELPIPGDDYAKRSLYDADTSMDLHNNAIGQRIGMTAKSYEEAQRMAHAEIRAAAIKGGTGENGTAKFRPESEWRDRDERKPNIVWPLRGLAQSSEVESILGRPPETWSEDEAQKVMKDRIYWDTNHPRQAEAFEAVRRSFEHRPDKSEPRSGDAGSGGPVQVRSYKRDDGTKVDAHSRNAPALDGR